MQKVSENQLSRRYLVKTRFAKDEYLIDQKTYFHIMDLVRFYHESIYMLPDDEYVRAEKIDDPHHTSPCDIQVNHLVFG